MSLLAEENLNNSSNQGAGNSSTDAETGDTYYKGGAWAEPDIQINPIQFGNVTPQSVLGLDNLAASSDEVKQAYRRKGPTPLTRR